MAVVPERLTRFDRTYDELAELLFFSVAVAGKNAANVARAVSNFFEPARGFIINYLATECFSTPSKLEEKLRAARVGKYGLMKKFVESYLNFGASLQFCTVNQLEEIHGVGPKTARMFLLHSRPNQEFAVLDVHILRFMREVLLFPNVPKNTPSGKRYLELEKQYLDYVRSMKDCNEFIFYNGDIEHRIPITHRKDGEVDLAAFDLAVWNFYKKGESGL